MTPCEHGSEEWLFQSLTELTRESTEIASALPSLCLRPFQELLQELSE